MSRMQLGGWGGREMSASIDNGEHGNNGGNSISIGSISISSINGNSKRVNANNK